MITRLILIMLLGLISGGVVAQDESLYSSTSIPIELLKDANAVVRWDEVLLEISAYNKMVLKNKRIVTIFNSSGNSKHGAYMHYDNNVTIRKLEVRVFDASGNEIKKVKKSDFEDVSAVSGGTLFSDSRVKYLNYTPVAYPYTILFETEVEHRSTGFLPGWRPLEGYFTSTQNSDYKIVNSSGIPVKIKTANFDGYNIEKLNEYEFSVKKIPAIKPESYSPAFSSFTPILKATLTEFEMEGVKGSNNDWSEFGKWMNESLIQGTEALPESTKNEIKTITANATSNMEKAKLVYQYVQNKTRYISVQVGIGGWKPMLASDVDRLGYGDCKGLSNYTKALLDEVGVESYYAVIYGDRDIRHIEKSFSSIEGNHVVLCIPAEDENIWLECTSQTSPFGYNANFTDDRDALIITPEGGKIVHTTIYKTEDNLLNTEAVVNLNNSGDFTAIIDSESQGTQYGYHEGIQNQKQKDQIIHYKDYWNHINNLDILSMNFNNDKDKIIFSEKIEVSADRYASKSGNLLLIQPNLFNRMESAPMRYEERRTPFEVERGFTDIDSYQINFPENLEIEALMDNINIESAFGKYEASIEQIHPNKLLYKRKLILNKGSYNKEDYNAFREFMLSVVKNDKNKIVLKNKS